jgi:anti-sigma factor RsiW
MDHSQALGLHAAEKYLLGELAPEVREQFEAHYFECGECANDVKAGAAFIDCARALFKECPGLPRISGRL